MLEMEEEMEGKKVEELVELLVVKRWRKWVVMASQEAWAAVGLSVGCKKKKKRNERERRRVWLYNGRRYIIICCHLFPRQKNAQKRLCLLLPNAAPNLRLG